MKVTLKNVKLPGNLARVGKLILVPGVGALMNICPNFKFKQLFLN